MPSVCADETHCPTSFDWVELAAIVIFTIEYFLRLYAAPEAYPASCWHTPLKSVNVAVFWRLIMCCVVKVQLCD